MISMEEVDSHIQAEEQHKKIITSHKERQNEKTVIVSKGYILTPRMNRKYTHCKKLGYIIDLY